MKETRKITLEEIQLPIAGKIRSYEEYIASILHSDNRYVASITDYILSNRGKQLRPLLVLLSAALHGEVADRSYMGASLVEMIHTASLIHDDVVDEAYVRRSAPSVNALWHSRTAVLIGDYIFARTYHVSLQNGGWDMLTEVTRSIHEVCEGELIQTEQTEKLAMTEAIYYDIIYKKTASLLGACAAVGAISVGAPADRVAALRQFGDHLGIAFQIKDDILDVEELAMNLLDEVRRNYPDLVAQRYKLDAETLALPPYELLEAIGRKRGLLVRGGEVNTERCAIMLVDEFRACKWGRISLERPPQRDDLADFAEEDEE